MHPTHSNARPHRLTRAILVATTLVSGVAAAAPVAIRDRAVVAENSTPVAIAVLVNDSAPAGVSELRISSPPMGTATIDGRGTADAGDDRVVYAPPQDFSGMDVFSYQVCETGDTCAESQIEITVRPSVDRRFDTPSGAGFADIELERQRDLPDVLFRTTPLAWPLLDAPTVTVDPTPLQPWDSAAGVAVVARDLPEPSNGQPQRWRVVVDARGEDGDVDVYLGVDANGNRLPDPGEIQCTGAMSTVAERCELSVTHPGTMPVVWWVAYHNRHDAPQVVRAEAFQVNLDTPSNGTLVATGPGDVPALLPFPLRIAWYDPHTWPGSPRLGYVRVVSAGTETGVFPVRVDTTTAAEAPMPLGQGTKSFTLEELGVHDRLFIDVPPGATELRVVVNANTNIDLAVGPGSAPPEPAIGFAPGFEQAVAVSEGPGSLETLTITAPTLTAGRWFVRVSNVSEVPAQVNAQAFLTATAPTVRPGSYFNPERSGHGVFLYPAADQWTGLWYTYFQDRSPTWYYLQANAPGANGIWQAPLYRAAWDGDSRELVAVGSVTLTPVGPDRFTWAYRIDGETGAETFEALGRGCPTLDGEPVDASSTWYDPAKDGTGYSVQYWPDYEYYAAFVYDALGVPRFITAERTSFGGAENILQLEQLRGFCPLCERTGDPERSDIGAFGRAFDEVPTLDQIAVTGLFRDGVPGTWSTDDTVQPLGGAGTTQGCEP